MPLTIRQRVITDVVILDLIGRLWILDLPLRDRMTQHLTDGHRHFVLNLAGVDYIDSSGLGQLVSIWTSVRGKGGHMTILNPGKRVQRLFEITRLNTVFQFSESEADAVDRVLKAS